MSMANKAILRPYTQLLTMEDVINKFQGAKKFSKLGLREAYHQFELTTESRKITTFYGPDGLYRYKRLNYGTKSAQDILQNEMRSILAGIPYQINIADDILIAGSTKEHDQALKLVLTRLQDNGMTVNTKKCQFDVEDTPFIGLIFNKKGIQPDPTKVEALHLAGPLKSKEELRSLLGMAGFSERFIPNYAKVTAPLQELLKEGTRDWDEKHQRAFEQLQQALQEDTITTIRDWSRNATSGGYIQALVVLELFFCGRDRQPKVSALLYSNHEALAHQNPTIQLPRERR
ncbi:Hypothetical predicted protein [Paramuricea clavata]|uniref:Reverse transcriptase domain-containing protein n=1 Tax=Paramuricea clavata TaxID=317549 RepID=A0A6S7H2V0_PARCT|nr:Hypothetical predicted protein [Paramuricea clavata]